MVYEDIIFFLIMLNPFALFLYLKGVMDELSTKDFYLVLLKASLISYLVFLVFSFFGYKVFLNFFQINFQSFRIFGGIIIFAYAFKYIMQGGKTMITMKESLEDLSSEIALPFMVGAGTISLAVLIGYKNNMVRSSLMLLVIMAVNYIVIIAMKAFKDILVRKVFRQAFDKYSSVLIRINGFFAGAIGIDMIVKGIQESFKIGMQ